MSPVLTPSNIQLPIVGIVGNKRSGKDTFFNELCSQLWYFNRIHYATQQPQRFAFADRLKEMLCAAIGITLKELEDNKEEYRERLQNYGSMKREEDPRFWIKELVLSSKWQHATGWKFITDVRYMNEAEFVKDSGGILLRVSRPSLASNDMHESETELRKIQCDYTIMNSGGIIEYRSAIAAFIPTLLKEAGFENVK